MFCFLNIMNHFHISNMFLFLHLSNNHFYTLDNCFLILKYIWIMHYHMDSILFVYITSKIKFTTCNSRTFSRDTCFSAWFSFISNQIDIIVTFATILSCWIETNCTSWLISTFESFTDYPCLRDYPHVLSVISQDMVMSGME